MEHLSNDQGDNNDIEIEYSRTSDEVFNNIASCINAYDFLDRARADIAVIEMDYDESIKASMQRCVESVCWLVSEIHENVVPDYDGEE